MQPQLTQAHRRTRRRAWAKLLLAVVSLGAITLCEVAGWYFGEATPVGGDLGYEAGGALASMLCLVALGGSRLLSPTRSSTRTTWRVCWWFVFVSGVMMALDIMEMIAWGETVAPGWELRLFETALLCLLIGICEEAMLRGVFLEGLLARMGDTRRGMWSAIIASSLFFGLLHIDFYELDAANALEVAQAVLKVAQTGVYGLALACCVVKTRDVLTPALVHGLDDFLLLFSSTVLAGESTSDVSYVATDTSEAVSTIFLYLVMIALYLPPAIRAVRLLRNHDIPDHGVLMAKAEAEEAAVAERLRRAQAAQAWQQPACHEGHDQPLADRQPYQQADDAQGEAWPPEGR